MTGKGTNAGFKDKSTYVLDNDKWVLFGHETEEQYLGLCYPTGQLLAACGYLNLNQLKWNQIFGSLVTLANIQVPNSSLWLVATILDNAYHCRKFSCRTLLQSKKTAWTKAQRQKNPVKLSKMNTQYLGVIGAVDA